MNSLLALLGRGLWFTILVTAGLVLSACGGNEPQPDSQPQEVEEIEGLPDYQAKVSLKRLWVKRIGPGQEKKFFRLSPVVDGQQIYAADYHGQLLALDVESGAVLWRVQLDDRITSSVGVNKDHVYVGTENGMLVCLRRQNGEEAWRQVLSSEMISRPIANSQRVVAQTIDDKLFVLDASTGEQLWDFSSNLPSLTLRGTSTPLLGNETTIAGFSNGKISALDNAIGFPRWEYRLATPSGRSDIELLVDIDGEFLLTNNRLIATGYQGNIAALDVLNGRELWRKENSSYVGLVEGFGSIYTVTAEGEVHALSMNQGASIWRQAGLRKRQLTRPVVYKNYLLVADHEGFIHVLSQVDGALVGRKNMGQHFQPLTHKGKLFRDNYLNHFQQAKTPVRTAILSSADRLFIFNESGYLAAFQLKSRGA